MPYYDPAALADYLAKSRGEGVVPSFTNVRSEQGPNDFYINSGGPDNATDEEEEDISLVPPSQYTDLKLLNHDILQLEHSIQDRQASLVEEAKEKAGVNELRKYYDTFVAAGLSESDSAKQYAERIKAAEAKAYSSLGLDSKGQFTGELAGEFRGKLQHIDRLKLRAKELAEDERLRKKTGVTERDIQKAGIQSGLSDKGIEKAKQLADSNKLDTDLAIIDIGSNEHKREVVERSAQGRPMPITELLVDYPEGVDVYTKDLDNQFTEDKRAVVRHYLPQWQVEVEKASDAVTDISLRNSDVQYAGASVKDRKAMLENAKYQARLLKAEELKNDFINKTFMLDNVDLDTVPGFTPKERELAKHLLKLYNESTSGGFETPAGTVGQLALNIKLAEQFAQTAPFSHMEDGTGHPIYGRGTILFSSIPENERFFAIKTKLINAALASYNMQYGDSLGVQITRKHPAVLRLGLPLGL